MGFLVLVRRSQTKFEKMKGIGATMTDYQEEGKHLSHFLIVRLKWRE